MKPLYKWALDASAFFQGFENLLLQLAEISWHRMKNKAKTNQIEAFRFVGRLTRLGRSVIIHFDVFDIFGATLR